MGRKPTAISLFFSQFGESRTVIPDRVMPEYRAQASGSSINTRMGRLLLSTENPEISGSCRIAFFPSSADSIPLLLATATRSRATPIWEAASTRFGVSPMVSTISSSTPNQSAAGNPTGAAGSRTMMPACEFPSPSSSSAQIIPSEISPRILVRWRVISFSPKQSVVPMVATATFWPAATLGAPHTIFSGVPVPVSTVVRLRWSELGCFSQVRTSPMTTPFRPPLTDWNSSIPSTSRPQSVKYSATLSGSRSRL